MHFVFVKLKMRQNIKVFLVYFYRVYSVQAYVNNIMTIKSYPMQ